jgi:hypothetical protein
VVILNSHAEGCDGIIILNSSSEPVHVPLPNVTLDLLKSAKHQLKDLLGHCGVRTRGETASSRIFGGREDFSSRPPQEPFAEMLDWLWTNVVKPVYQALRLVSDYIAPFGSN